MRKYLALARAALLEAIQEKAEIMIWVILDAVPVFVMGSVWIANQQHIAMFNISQMVTYYIVSMVIGRMTEFYFDEEMSDQVRTGDFSKWLLKPLRFPFAFIPQTIGRKVFSGFVMLLPMLTLILVSFHRYLVFPDTPMLVFFALSLVVTVGLRFTFSAIAAAGAFFWEHAEALTHARWVLEIIAGGYMLPLSFYPSWLRFIPEALPFKYAYFVPVSIFTGTFDTPTILISLVGGVLWLTAMLFLTKWLWTIGIRRYSGVGG